MNRDFMVGLLLSQLLNARLIKSSTELNEKKVMLDFFLFCCPSYSSANVSCCRNHVGMVNLLLIGLIICLSFCVLLIGCYSRGSKNSNRSCRTRRHKSCFLPTETPSQLFIYKRKECESVSECERKVCYEKNRNKSVRLHRVQKQRILLSHFG